MKLAEVAHVTGTKISDFKTNSGAFGASFEGLCIRGNGVMSGTVGFSVYSKRDARKALAENVSNETVMTSNEGVRQNFPLPKVTA
jgi:hypothetical protein